MISRRLLSLTLAIGLASPAVARADVLTVWAAAKGVNASGTSDVFVNFDQRIAGGVEAGIELFGIDLFGEAMLLGSEQYFFTANLGFDFSFGDTFFFEVGGYTGPMLFLFPETEVATGLDLSGLTPQEQMILDAAAMASGTSIDELNQQFAMAAQSEKDLARTVLGWNIVRARAVVGFKIMSVLSVGLVGHAGYHVVISGQEVAAGAKNEAIEKFAAELMLPEPLAEEAKTVLRKAVGAKPVDKSNLSGMNYNVGAFVRLEF